MTNFLSYARGPQFMGRKSVRKNELSRSGGLLSFPRTGCALRASVILSRGQKSHDIGLQWLQWLGTSGWSATLSYTANGSVACHAIAPWREFLRCHLWTLIWLNRGGSFTSSYSRKRFHG